MWSSHTSDVVHDASSCPGFGSSEQSLDLYNRLCCYALHKLLNLNKLLCNKLKLHKVFFKPFVLQMKSFI